MWHGMDISAIFRSDLSQLCSSEALALGGEADCGLCSLTAFFRTQEEVRPHLAHNLEMSGWFDSSFCLLFEFHRRRSCGISETSLCMCLFITSVCSLLYPLLPPPFPPSYHPSPSFLSFLSDRVSHHSSSCPGAQCFSSCATVTAFNNLLIGRSALTCICWKTFLTQLLGLFFFQNMVLISPLSC